MDKEWDKSKAKFIEWYNGQSGLELKELEDLDKAFIALVIDYKAKTE
jgi:hypothetical protein